MLLVTSKTDPKLTFVFNLKFKNDYVKLKFLCLVKHDFQRQTFDQKKANWIYFKVTSLHIQKYLDEKKKEVGQQKAKNMIEKNIIKRKEV